MRKLKEFAGVSEPGILKWLEQVERIDEGTLTKRVDENMCVRSDLKGDR